MHLNNKYNVVYIDNSLILIKKINENDILNYK